MSRQISVAVVVLMVAGVCHASGPTQVSVVLTGPTEGWAGDGLGYSADGDFTLDQETQDEVVEGQASIEEEWDWGYGPASCETPPAEHPSETFKFSEDDAPGTYTISVTYTVTVRYADDTCDSASASDSINVKIKLYVNIEVSAAKSAICAGALSSAPHQCTVTATATDRQGNPMAGRTIDFSIDDPEGETYVSAPASFSPGSATTDQDGHATTTLTSSDKVCTLTVVAKDSQTEDEGRTWVGVALPGGSHSPGYCAIEAGLAKLLTETVTYGGDPLADHTMRWDYTSCTDEYGEPMQLPGPAGSAATDANGVASISFSHTPAGYVTLGVKDLTCYGADEEHPILSSAAIVAVRLDFLRVISGDAYQCDDDAWATGVRNNPSYVTIRAYLLPSVPEAELIGNNWSGGVAAPDPLERYVSRQTVGTFLVTCTIGNSSDSVTIYVCEVDYLTVYAGGSMADGCAVSTVEPSGEYYVVLEAHLNPTPPTVPGMLIWWSGATRDQAIPTRAGVSRAHPTHQLVTCTVGDSSASMSVYVIAFDVRAPGVGDGTEDDPAELYVNSDDDNGNEEDDRGDSPVQGEDDLYALTIRILPDDVPEGTLSLALFDENHDESDDLALWEDDEKTTAADDTYSVSSGAPEYIWVEGLVVSAQPADEEVEISYTWGSVELSDSVFFTVLPREGQSGAVLKLYDDEDRTHAASSPVAGVVYPVLEVTVGAGERLASSSANLIVRDDYKGYFSGTEVDASIDDLSPQGGWQIWDAANNEWDSSSGPVGSDNQEGSEPLLYRALFAPWDTMKVPLGNNGDHSLFLGETVDNEWAVMHLQFEEWVVGTGWSNAYELGPTPIATEARNLYISNCTSSNGTIDYFKYDPDGDQSLAQPHITFSIVDPDPHNYCCIIRFRQTVGEGTWNWDSGWYSMRAVLSGTTADINLTAEDYQGNCLEPEDGWGTYTYEVLVLEYEGGTPVWTQGEALDWQFLKRYRDGYHLWVPKNLPAPYGEEPGHDVWTEVPEEGEAQLRGYYVLEGDWGAGEAQVPRGNDAQIVIVDPELAERSQTTGPGAVATLGAAYGTVDADEDEALDGLALYTYQEEDPAGTWRGIFTASDNGGLRSPAWRTHEPVRMITANQQNKTPQLYLLLDNDTFETAAEAAHVDWIFVSLALRHPSYIKYWLFRDGTYVDDFNDTQANPIPENGRDTLRGRAHIVLLGEWQSAGSSIQKNEVMTAGTLKGKVGTVDSPERCGIVTFNFNEFLQDHQDWDTAAYYTKILMHEIVHACQEDSLAHCEAAQDSWCIMRPEGVRAIHGQWWYPSHRDRAFFGCSLGDESQHPRLMHEWVGEHTR